MVKVQKNKRERNGEEYDQFTVTIPRKVAKARDWEQGTEIDFKTIKSGKFAGQLRIEEKE